MEQNKPTELKPCPFCRKNLTRYGKFNPYATCETDGCWLSERKIGVPLDAPEIVAQWNTRSDTLDKWQPIETAPKDKIIFLTNGKDADYYCRWYKNRWNFWGVDDFDGMAWVKLPYEPTHWMQLPNPPKQAEQLTKES